MSDRIAKMYKHVWRYIDLLKRLQKAREKLRGKFDISDLEEKFVSYSERFASLLEKEGVLSLLSFIASKSKRKVWDELSEGVEKAYRVNEYSDEELKKLKDVESEDLAHSLLYDCYARWLIEFKLADLREEYKNDPLVLIGGLVEKFGDMAFKHHITEELFKLAIAVKHLAAGEFKR